MITHMKTTIDIPDSLFREVRRLASERRTTFKAIVEAALRGVVNASRAKPIKFKLKWESFRGEGLCEGISEGDWGQIRDLIYKGHGS